MREIRTYSGIDYSNKGVTVSAINTLFSWSFQEILIESHSSIFSSWLCLWSLLRLSGKRIFQFLPCKSLIITLSRCILIISPISLPCSGLLQLAYVLIIPSYPVYRMRNFWIESSAPERCKRSHPTSMILNIIPSHFFKS